MRIFVIRHGETAMNAAGIVQGPVHDAPLSARGRAQAEAVGERFANTKIDAVYASPLSRAHETGETIARRVDAPCHAAPGFAEFHWGKFCGRRQTGEDGEQMTAIVRRWRAGELDLAPEGGESPMNAAERARRTFSQILEHHDGADAKESESRARVRGRVRDRESEREHARAHTVLDAPGVSAVAATSGSDVNSDRTTSQPTTEATIVIVAHGRLNKVMLAMILDSDLRCMEDYPQANTGVTLLQGPRPNWGAAFVNDTSHLIRAGLEAPVNHLRERA